MPDRPDAETEIIHAAYAEKVKDAFMAFADNLSAGQGEKPCKERFLRSVGLVKRARDLALEAIRAELTVEVRTATDEIAHDSEGSAAGRLSAADQASIDQAVGATTGLAKLARPS
jgi:hypothetical protein